MGVQPKNCVHLGLIWMFGLLFCALLVHAKTRVSADPQEDEDLVFDNLDVANFQSLTRESSDIYSKLPPSQLDEEDQEHWLTRTVNRIKRSIGNLFSSEEKQPKSKSHLNQKGYEGFHRKNHRSEGHSDLHRNHRQADYEAMDEDDEYDEEDMQPDGPDNDEDNEDDDDDTFGSGKSSGDGESHDVEDRLMYYRVWMSVEEFYDGKFGERDSPQFTEFAVKIESGLNELLRSRRASYISTLISIEKHPSDPFKVLATVDVTCKGMCDDENIESTIFNEIQTNTRLGSATVYPDEFWFMAYTGTPTCEVDQFQCRSRQCIDANLRCNGIRDCNDNSDEIGCPSTTTARNSEEDVTPTIPTTTTTFTTPTTTPTMTTTTTTTTTTPTPTTSFPDFGSGDGDGDPGRSDDIAYCDNGRQKYYGYQRCDRIPDCDDGSDEKDCLCNNFCFCWLLDHGLNQKTGPAFRSWVLLTCYVFCFICGGC